MNKKYYIVGIRNVDDDSVRSVSVVESLDQFILDLRTFLADKSKATAYHQFPEHWELVYSEVGFGTDYNKVSFNCYMRNEDEKGS